MQHKTQRPVPFEITSATREAVQKWIKLAGPSSEPSKSVQQRIAADEPWKGSTGTRPKEPITQAHRETRERPLNGSGVAASGLRLAIGCSAQPSAAMHPCALVPLCGPGARND